MIEYTWGITNIECQPDAKTLDNYVTKVYWNINGSDGINLISQIGSIDFQFAPNIKYKPYGELTQDDVIGWVQTALGIDGVTGFETFIANVIDAQNKPTKISLPLPWNK